MPRLVGRAKSTPPPAELAALDLAPRHLTLFALLVFDGPQTVSELAGRLGVAPTTVSLLVGDLSRKGVLERRPDERDRRRRIVDIVPASRPAIEEWLSPSARAWRAALDPLDPRQRRLVVETLKRFESQLAGPLDRVDDEDRFIPSG
ncbi:winged helix-turn-helix transcriptional regulator [Actinoplanes sp. LDG1-01]|uniref:Winged helix-turn-helix transcriptional regulator n=2 Tax=Paractinoplanes lichenicola TaxID=2802976 RepID=A0ABS1VT41_9ACTN|nr:winged helix-turn-helix transcriptional regulator [Actinoplanes lichenicola]